MLETLRQDFQRYHRVALTTGPRLARLRACLRYGFIAVCLHRYGRWTRTLRPRWLSLPFKLIYAILKIPVELLLGIDISGNANIGPGLYIDHFGGIFLHCDAGRNLSVTQDVTLGYKGAGRSTRWPRLGDDVYIGAGAKVIGDVSIGDGVLIGANTVVTKDVPAHMRVVGAAIRISPLECLERTDLSGEGTAAASPSSADTPARTEATMHANG
ncbi:serine O-acetyltransferase [Marilutibacter alkalisoli]|uniref:Serine acetyltransferase n=1 Tax=Marilutibacter alkalisoli TaxID=2591633 RepID=A0A514BQU4_9GAMM|nr:serine acetyltransferase [Lysobacter alkalisoli]QDH69747.1 serine acetyltransferase [Lysobacter alkalisoli]